MFTVWIEFYYLGQSVLFEFLGVEFLEFDLSVGVVSEVVSFVHEAGFVLDPLFFFELVVQ